MSEIEQDINEYVDLPDDPEMAFSALQKRKYAELQRILASQEGLGWYHERRYVDILVSFDEVHSLGIFSDYGDPPLDDNAFSEFYMAFRRHAEITAQKIKMEAARRRKVIPQSVIILDATARKAIHILINAIREKLDQILLPETKRESLFNKLNEFAAEVDRNRTRTEAFLSFVVDISRAGKKVADEIKPLQQTIDRVLDCIDRATKWNDALPPWKDRKGIEGPPKRLTPPQQDFDDEIPF